MQEKNRRSLLLRVITTLVMLTLSVGWSDGQPVTCTIPSVEKGQVAALTCHFGVDMQDSDHGDIIIQRNTTSDKNVLGEVLDCYWGKGEGKDQILQYQCTVMNSRFVFQNEISWNVSIYLPSVSDSDVGQYFCNVDRKITRPCSFTLKDPPTTTPPPPPPSPVWTGLAVFLLLVVIVLIIFIILLIYYPDKIIPKLQACCQMQSLGPSGTEPNAVGPEKEEMKHLLPQDVRLSTQPRSESPVHEAGDSPQVNQPVEDKEEEKKKEEEKEKEEKEKEEQKSELKDGDAQRDAANKDQQQKAGPQGDQGGERAGPTAVDLEGNGGAGMGRDSVAVQIEGVEQQAGKPDLTQA